MITTEVIEELYKLVILTANRCLVGQKEYNCREHRKQSWWTFKKQRLLHDKTHDATQWEHEQFTQYEQEKISVLWHGMGLRRSQSLGWDVDDSGRATISRRPAKIQQTTMLEKTKKRQQSVYDAQQDRHTLGREFAVLRMKALISTAWDLY